MGLLNLVGRISLDGGPFKQALQGLKKEASSFGSVLSGQLSGLVGAGAMIGLAKGGTLFFSDDDIRNLKTADDLLTKFGNTARVAFAKLIDPKLGPLTQILGAMGINAFGVLDKPAQRKAPVDEAPMLADMAAKEEASKVHMAVQERLLKINKEIATVEEKNRIAGFTDDEMRVDLALRREEIFKRIARTEEDRAQKELDLRLNEQAILGVSKVSAKTSSPLKDSLTSVGNFIGMNPNSGQMKELSEMNRKLESIVRNTSRTGGSIFPQ